MKADIKTHWKQLVNTDYLGAYSLPNGQDITVKIINVSREMVKGANGRDTECTVAQIENNKPLILNRTNCKTISKIYHTPFIEEWIGKEITLFADTTKLKGEVVECLRIRSIVPKQKSNKKERISEERLSQALKQIEQGNYSKEQLKTKFSLTEEQLKKVNSHVSH